MSTKKRAGWLWVVPVIGVALWWASGARDAKPAGQARPVEKPVAKAPDMDAERPTQPTFVAEPVAVEASPASPAPAGLWSPDAAAPPLNPPGVADVDEAPPPQPDRSVELAAIQAAAARYEAAALPEIDRFLLHSDPAVREAARDGMIQLGEAEGAKYLRAAADKVKDPREAVALLDAADYLELPSALPVERKPGASTSNPPLPPRPGQRR